MLAFFSLVVISLFRVKQLSLGLYGTIKWLELILLVIYIRETFRETFQYTLTAYTIAIGGALEAILGLWQFHVQHMIGFTWLGEYIPPMGVSGLATLSTVSGKVVRAYGTFPHPNVLEAFLVFGLVMSFYIGFRIKDLGLRILVSCGTVLITLGIFVTFSRLAWLVTAITYLSLGIYWLIKKNWSQILVIVIVALVSCGTIWFGYHSMLKARVTDTDERAVSDRVFFNDLGLRLISQHPGFGVGVGNYVPALQAIVKLDSWQYQPAHNIFIFLAAELGIGALAIFILLLWEIMRPIKNILSSSLIFSCYFLFIIFLILGQFDHYFVTIQQGRLVFFIAFGLLAALPNLNEKLD